MGKEDGESVNVTGDQFVCVYVCKIEMGAAEGAGQTCHIRRHDYPPGLHFNQSEALVPVCHHANPIKGRALSACQIMLFPFPTMLNTLQSCMSRVNRALAWRCHTPTQQHCIQSTNNSFNFKMLQRGFSHWRGKLIVAMHFHFNSNKKNSIYVLGHYWWVPQWLALHF